MCTNTTDLQADRTMISEMDLELSAEMNPPKEIKRRDKKWRRHPRPGALTKRGPPRPHRRLSEDILKSRISKLTARVEKAKRQVRVGVFA